jgi:hypothetical protein
MCQLHYSLTNRSSTVMNKSITASTTDPITKSSTATTNLFTVTNQSSTVITNKSSTVTNEPCTMTNNYLCTVSNKAGTVTTESSTVMEIDIVIQQVMEFVGMGNWEQLHTFAAVCKLWRHSSLLHLFNIGKVLMDGRAERRLNVGAFLRYLQSEHFRNVQCIFIPCRKTKGLFVNDIKQATPSVQTIVHIKWLMVNGRMGEMQEGGGHHQCYRVYRHDMDFSRITSPLGPTPFNGCCQSLFQLQNVFMNCILASLLSESAISAQKTSIFMQ